MALTRKLLKSMGIEEDKIDQIIDAHAETVDGLKDKLKTAEADSEKLKAVQRELDDLKAKGDDPYKKKYEDAKKYDFVPEWADIIPKLDDGFKKLNIFPNTLVAGTEFIVDGVKIEVLRVANPAMHNNFGNNQSCVFKISDSKRSFIFLGDLGIEGGKELLASKYASKLKSDYCQMAHHGQNGCTRDVYEAIAPKVCLWPAPAWLWDNDNGGGKGSGPWATLTVRGWMEELGVKTNYTEKDGIVEIK